MEAVGTWNVPTPLEEVHQDLETKERKKQLFYYHQANAAVNALGARVTEEASPPRTPCMCASGAGADRAPPPALLALVALAVVRAAAARPVARDTFQRRPPTNRARGSDGFALAKWPPAMSNAEKTNRCGGLLLEYSSVPGAGVR